MVVEEQLNRMVADARAILQGNDLGGSTKPSPGLYPHQWNWDSCFIAIGISRYDTARACQEIRSLLRGQWRNGLVPQIVFNPEGTGYFPGPDVWQSERSPDAPSGVATSGITQPPVLATAALAIWTNAHASGREEATAFLREVYPKIRLYHQFLYSERDPDGTGLAIVVHPWESGLDNSPPYLDAGDRVHLTYQPKYERLDTLHVQAKYRPTNKNYDLFVWLLEQMREVNWSQTDYLKHATLQVEDVIFNSILCRANADLARIAEIVGEDPSEALAWRERTATAINDRLWSEEGGMYYSYDRVAGRLLKDETIAGILTLYGGVAPRERADRLVEVHLRNPREFWPEGGYPVPTTALDETRWFNPENYWLGPVWINMNWLVIHGLVESGRSELGAWLTTKTLDLIERRGFHEYFNPYSGEGYGTDSFSWSAALTIDMIEAMERR
jgi:neutral trehalase